MRCRTRAVRLLAPRYGFVLLADGPANATGLGDRRIYICECQMRQGKQGNSDGRAPPHAGPQTSSGHRTGQTGVQEGPLDAVMGPIADTSKIQSITSPSRVSLYNGRVPRSTEQGSWARHAPTVQPELHRAIHPWR